MLLLWLFLVAKGKGFEEIRRESWCYKGTQDSAHGMMKQSIDSSIQLKRLNGEVLVTIQFIFNSSIVLFKSWHTKSLSRFVNLYWLKVIYLTCWSLLSPFSHIWSASYVNRHVMFCYGNPMLFRVKRKTRDVVDWSTLLLGVIRSHCHNNNELAWTDRNSGWNSCFMQRQIISKAYSKEFWRMFWDFKN